MDKTTVKCIKSFHPFQGELYYNAYFIEGIEYDSEPDYEGIVLYGEGGEEYYPDITELLHYFRLP